ncbi:phosphoribosyltransferase [Limoniibacter endophyticus]|nr:phosphoribosyltransferase [Limoniibacter endophyticus]
MTELPMDPLDFWQEIFPPHSFDPSALHRSFYPATLNDARQIKLPIRPIGDGHSALASLIINQASFTVQDVLAEQLAAKLSGFQPDIVIGLPTLGLTLASQVARKLGHSRYVPLGTSRKFWYEDALSVPLSSITTAQVKQLYVDPRMLPLVKGKRVALVDDVISSGSSIRQGVELLRKIEIEPVVIGCAMLQSERWKDELSGVADRICGVFSTPILSRSADNMWAA